MILIAADAVAGATSTPAGWATAVIATMVFFGQVVSLYEAWRKRQVDAERAAVVLAASAAATRAAEVAASHAEQVRVELVRTGTASVAKLDEVKDQLVTTRMASIEKLDAVKDELAATGTASIQKLDEVKVELTTTGAATTGKLNELLRTGAATHTLVNSARGEQLKIVSLALRRVVEMRVEMGQEPHPDDVTAADMAEKLYQEHMASQSRVDQAMAGNHP